MSSVSNVMYKISSFLQPFCMMVQPTSIVIVAALLTNTLSYCSAENVYCVTPTATSCSSCPPNSTNCTTLSEYAHEAELYFTSNTTMVFLAGDHVLDVNITVANVARLTMRGVSFSDIIATVVRNGSVGFNFTNMVDFNIYSLAFTSYNRSWSYDSLPASNSALLLQSTRNAKLVNCSFHDNLGTALTVHDTNITLVGNSEFIHNQCGCEYFSNNCKLGCGITALNSNLRFNGNTTFRENTATFYGNILFYYYNAGSGAIWGTASSLDFDGTNNFIGNLARSGSGGAIYAETNSLLSFSGTSNFCHNTAELYGGAIEAYDNTSLHFSGSNNFTNNSAQYGGAIEAHNNVVFTLNGMNNFINNSAEFYGGAIASFNVTFTFNGINSFMSNSAEFYGGAIHAQTNSSLSFKGTSDFSRNSAYRNDGGAINTHTNTEITFTGTNSFSNNSAVKGGAISANVSSTLTFDGNISFTNNGHNTNEMNINENVHGGAIHLAFSSIFFLMPNTTVYWENNHASLGGAIYVFNTNPLIYCKRIATVIGREECFFQLPGQYLSSDLDVHFIFKNNSADTAGSVLYGGAIDNCTLNGLESNNSGEVFHMLSQYEGDNTTPNISSDPFRICPCENNLPDCSKSEKTLSVYPGETFHISVVTTGQGNETIPALVRSRIGNGGLLSSQYIQQINKTCTTLNYTVFSLMTMSQVELYADGPCSTFGDILTLKLNINLTCPPGFDISKEKSSCVCYQALQKYTNSCNITNGLGQITRESDDTFWVGYNEQTHELTVHPHCPFDYCVNGIVVFPLNNTDIQCANNRAGILCGACNHEQCNDSLACNSTRNSLVLGTSRCKQCSNLYLLLLIPFAVMGIALVFLLLVCNLTVATGTLSGLVFYANIVGVNRIIFLPEESPALSVFIAWLNLDFGIETCFYDGMDAYSKTWLQFVFPVYIWLLVGLMTVISHFSQRFANLLGSNPVSVMATLILLSYAKILQTLITAVSFTDLTVYEHQNREVWLHDGNIDYLSDKHIPLYIVAALVFLFLFLPYTLLLLFGQWLQAISHLRLFSWVNRLKPFMDSYHAPYKAKHRYWPGLLLVLRFVLLLVFAVNYQRDPSINLLAISVGAGILQLWAWVSGGVYKNWCLDALEGSFVLNLIVLSVATYHVQLSGGNQLAVGYTSVSIALATFIGILAYHIFQQLRNTKVWKKVPKLNMKLRFKKMKTKLNKKLSAKQTEDISLNDLTNDLTESVRFDQLREPLLDDLPQPTHSVV